MHVTNYRFTLDVNDAASQAMLSMRKGDSARRLLVTLSEGGKPYSIAEGCYAVFNAVRSDGAVYFGDCIVSDNVIACELDKAIATAEGRIDCDIALYGADGESLTSPRFALIVYAGVTTGDELEGTDEYHTLGELVLTANKTSTELMELKNTIADETAKANAAIQEFNGWYHETKDEMAELASDTKETCETLTKYCAQVIEDTETGTAELIENTERKCDNAIAEVDEVKESLAEEIRKALAEFSSVGMTVTLAADNWSNNAEYGAVQTVNIDGIAPTSSTAVVPESDSAAKYTNCGVRAVSQGEGVLTFAADEIPDAELSVKVATVSGQGGAILNCAPSYTEGGSTGVITGSYVGDGTGKVTVTMYYDAKYYPAQFTRTNTQATVNPRSIVLPRNDISTIILFVEDGDKIGTAYYITPTISPSITLQGDVDLEWENDSGDLLTDPNNMFSYSTPSAYINGNNLCLINNITIDKVKVSSIDDEYYLYDYSTDFNDLAGTTVNSSGVTYHYIAW